LLELRKVRLLDPSIDAASPPIVDLLVEYRMEEGDVIAAGLRDLLGELAKRPSNRRHPQLGQIHLDPCVDGVVRHSAPPRSRRLTLGERMVRGSSARPRAHAVARLRGRGSSAPMRR